MADVRPFRFGVEIKRAGSARAFRETLRKAQDLGFASVFVPDHFVDHPLAPVPALAAAAEAAPGLRIASGVLCNDFAHPVALARQAATLDLLSDGRLELGLGAGWRRILGLAAREAQIIGINAFLKSGEAGADAALSLGPARTDEKLAWVREAAGPRFAELEIQTLLGVVLPSDDPRAVAEGMAGAFGVSADEALETPVVLVGTVDSMVETLEARRERWQMTYHVVPQEALDAMAPVVARLA